MRVTPLTIAGWREDCESSARERETYKTRIWKKKKKKRGRRNEEMLEKAIRARSE